MPERWRREHMRGLDKITAVSPDFHWADLHSIGRLSYYSTYHAYNDYSDPMSCLEISFSLGMSTLPSYRVDILFLGVSALDIHPNDIPFSLYGFTVYDNKVRGYERSSRFYVGSYEQDDPINFYCEAFEVLCVYLQQE